jgi:hypothetical protein
MELKPVQNFAGDALALSFFHHNTQKTCVSAQFFCFSACK